VREEEKRKKPSKKRKASSDDYDDEENQIFKKAKTTEPTPQKKDREFKREGTSPREEKIERMETEVQEDEKIEKVQWEPLEKRPLLAQSVVVKAILTISRHPVSKYHKLDFTKYGGGYAIAKALFSDARPSSKYEVHAVLGATYFLIDVTCYAALLSLLHEGESAITQDIHVSVLAPIEQGSEVVVKAKIVNVKPKTGLIFLESEVFHNNKLMVTAKVIKSILEPDLPVKESTKEEKMKENQEKEKKDNNNIHQSL